MAKQKIQGEGDYEATRRYRKRTDEYLKNNDVEKAAVRAAPDIAARGRGHEGRGSCGQTARQGRGPGAAPARRHRASNRQRAARPRGTEWWLGEEAPQRLVGGVRRFFGQHVAALDFFAAHVVGPVFPDAERRRTTWGSRPGCPT